MALLSSVLLHFARLCCTSSLDSSILTFLYISLICLTYFSGTLLSLKHYHSFYIGIHESRLTSGHFHLLPQSRIHYSFLHRHCMSQSVNSTVVTTLLKIPFLFKITTNTPSLQASGIRYHSSIIRFKLHNKSTPASPRSIHSSIWISSGPIAMFFIFVSDVTSFAYVTWVW